MRERTRKQGIESSYGLGKYVSGPEASEKDDVQDIYASPNERGRSVIANKFVIVDSAAISA